MAKHELQGRWDLIRPREILTDWVLWLFFAFSLACGLASALFLPEASLREAMGMFINVVSIFFGVGVAAFGLVFGLLTGEIFKHFKAQPDEYQRPLDRVIGKFWFIVSFDCITVLAIFLCIPISYLGFLRLALFIVATGALLIIGSTYNLLNTAFSLLNIVRTLPDKQEHEP